MKELFRDREYTVVGYYQSVLKSEGIPTVIRNENISNMTAKAPIPDMFPALCLVNDEDEERARQILRDFASPEDEVANREEPTKGIFVLGVAIVCGGFVLRYLPTVLQSSVPAFWRASSAAVVLGAFWIVWITVKRWLSEKREVSQTNGG